MLNDRQQYIMDRVTVDENGCWLWKLSLDPDGYGHGCYAKRKRRSHRLAYEAFIGDVPEGLQLDHLCRVRRCANPAHLEPVTTAENVRRGEAGSDKRTFCKRGHAFSEHGRIDARGFSQCRECDRQRSKASYGRNRDKILGKMRAAYHEERRAQ